MIIKKYFIKYFGQIFYLIKQYVAFQTQNGQVEVTLKIHYFRLNA
jgi:hypothetical protein